MYYEALHHLILPSNLNDAVFFLNRLDYLIELHKIYQHFFPEAYAEDNFYCWAIHDDSISSWELNLFGLIDKNLFSLPDSLVNGEEFFSLIPAWPITPDWWDAELEDLSKSFQLVLFLSNNISMGFFREIPDWLKEIEVEGVDKLDFLKLEALAKQAGEPLTALPKVLEILDHCTGNIWLDSTNEAYLEFEWTNSNIERLRNDWLEAQAIYSQISELDEWLEEKQNILAFCQLFYECDSEPHDPESLATVLQPYL